MFGLKFVFMFGFKKLRILGFILEPCPFGFGLVKFALDPVVVIFFKNAEKITSGGLIQSL